jgi:hypothetical protein
VVDWRTNITRDTLDEMTYTVTASRFLLLLSKQGPTFTAAAVEKPFQSFKMAVLKRLI